jgi:hypothetical protein
MKATNSKAAAPAGTTRSSPKLWTWFLAGCGFAVFLIATQAFEVGGMAGLLLVGEDAQIRPFIESVLGSVPIVPGSGHDGQIYFAVAHDLDGDVVSKLIYTPGIRYRRPLFPVLASMGGLLEGRDVLWLSAAWITLGFGASAAAFRGLLARLEANPIWMVALFAYPGFWMATRLLTPDMVALGLVLAGLLLVLRGGTLMPIVAFTLAALTKETFVVVALASGAWLFFRAERARGIAIAGFPAVGFFGYAAFVLTKFDAPALDPNFGLPFTGIIEATAIWPNTPASDQALVIGTLGMLVLAMFSIGVARSALVRWLIAPWLLIGLISSDQIWGVGNGTIRSFAPVALFVVLAVAERTTGNPLTADPLVRHQSGKPEQRPNSDGNPPTP